MKLSFDVHIHGMDALPPRIPSLMEDVEDAVAERVKVDTEPFVPAGVSNEDGHTPLYMRTRVEGNRVIYPGRYARFLYFGKLMVDPVTGSAWARRGVKKVLTDKNLVFTKTIHPDAQSRWFEASKAVNKDKWKDYAQEVLDRGGK